MDIRLTFCLAALLMAACGKTTHVSPMVCVNSGNEIALDDTCTDVVTRICDDPDDPQDCYFTSAVAVTCTECLNPASTDCPHEDPSSWLESLLSWEVSSCFSCGVGASFRINIHNGCATTLDLLAVDLIPEMTPYGDIDLAQQREQGLRCLVDKLHYMTISCDPEIPCLDVEVAGQCESP
jgi:hypothetical protein